jgi:hypothetical protein
MRHVFFFNYKEREAVAKYKNSKQIEKKLKTKINYYIPIVNNKKKKKK